MSETVTITNYVTSVEIEGTQIAVEISASGQPGEGVPKGGATGQSLVKTSPTDYDTEWADRVITVTGDGVGGTATNPVLSFPTPAEIGAYPDTNPDGYVDAAGAAAAAPVQSVTGTAVTGTAADPVIDLVTDIDVERLKFDTDTALEADTYGYVAWSNDDRTLQINKGNGVVQNVTQELNYAPARNAESTALQRGQLVMVDPTQPAQGQILRVKRYISNGTLPVDLFVGMVSEVIQPNRTGFIEWFGQLRGLSLPALQPMGETWAEGDILWPNPAIAGGMTKVEPTAPAHKVTVAAILRITGNNLNLLVRPNLRSRVADLHDVQVTTPTTGQALVYDGAKFVNGVEWTLTSADSGTLTGLNVVWLADTTAARNRTLDTAGLRLQVKDVTGTAATNNITLTAGSGQTINGNATEVIDVNYGWVEYVRLGTNWVTIGGQA